MRCVGGQNQLVSTALSFFRSLTKSGYPKTVWFGSGRAEASKSRFSTRGGTSMSTKTMSGIASAVVILGLFLSTSARAGDCERINKLLDSKDVYGYVITPITDEYVTRTLPGRTFLRLSEELEQDLFFTFSECAVNYSSSQDGALVPGQVLVLNGGTGEIDLSMPFDRDGNLGDVQETDTVRAGIRPICQATKLLDRDRLVRRMAEQDILVMGRSAKTYLDEQRAKAGPKLRNAIDRIWQRIVDEGR